MTYDVYAEATRRFAEGAAHLVAQEDAAAEQCFQEALRLAPTLPEPYVNLGILRERAQDWDGAERYYRRALAADTQCGTAHLNLANLLAQTGRAAEAEQAYFDALHSDPTEPRTWSNLGTLLSEDRRNDRATRDAEAEACYRQALALVPTYATARFHLACLLLRQGRFQEGWQAFESRDRGSSARPCRTMPLPEWRGEPLSGKRVLVCSEGGAGDMIQFCRYLPWLKERGAANVSLVCEPALVRLMQTLDGVDDVYSLAAPPSHDRFDVQTLPLSLPGLFQTGLESIPDNVPYLRPPVATAPPPGAQATWSPTATETERTCLRVGLAWRDDATYAQDPARSLRHLRMLARLGDLPDIEFVSLQSGDAAREVLELPDTFAVQPGLPAQADFADCAAAIDSLDLVIAVDTAVAHLAGALAVPCFLLLPAHQTDWRWMKNRSDTPWYPTTRLFRQPPNASWAPVIDAVHAALQDLGAARRAATEVVSP
jgi:Flp pilus assembly protein TadD